MAGTHRNIFSRGFTGSLRNPFVAHQTYSGKTILTPVPMFSEHQTYIESLKADQAALLEATTYAHFAKTQDVYLQKEVETGMTAYYLALTDWFGLPKVLEMNVDHWTGQVGQKIHVKARDNVMVARIEVLIRDVDDRVLEFGEAEPSHAGSLWWIYTTQTPVLLTPFPTVKVTAQDLPGNSASFTIH